MKKIFLNKMFVAVAMIFAASMLGACSSSSDDNNTQKEEEKKEPTMPTSGTLYVLEIAHPNVVKWADCYCSIGTSGSADNYKEFCSDSTSVANVKNSKVASVIKETIEAYQKYMKDMPDALDLSENCPVRVDSISITSIPSTLQVKYKYGVKSGFDATDEKQRFTYIRNYCVIDNFGNLTKYSDFSFIMDSDDLSSDKLSSFLENLALTQNMKVLVNDRGSLVVRE